jgi:D-alanine-D-alanine ligase
LIHGTHGEDGTLQGLLELAGLPYVGCGVAASALGMDKALMKAVFKAEGLPIPDYAVLRAGDGYVEVLQQARDIEMRFTLPVFVKPASGGSSLGVSKVRNREELVAGLAEAAKYDRKLIVEPAIEGREVDCAVLGNEDAQASPLGEVRHRRDFYDYEAKYLDPQTEILAPADLPDEVVKRAQELALRAFHAIDGAGLSRVDFFLLPDGTLLIDEINTIPGFTPGSMFPRLWQSVGVSYSELIARLIDLAMVRHREKPIA